MPTAVDAVVTSIEQALGALEPDLMEIYDESAEHAGHAGARAGSGHYQVLIVSRRFQGASRVARHRMVYQAVGPMLQKPIRVGQSIRLQGGAPHSTF